MRRKGMILAGICVLGLCAGCGQKKSTTLEQETIATLYFEGDEWVSKCEVKVSIEAGQRRFLSNHIKEGWFLNTETYSEAPDGAFFLQSAG